MITIIGYVQRVDGISIEEKNKNKNSQGRDLWDKPEQNGFGRNCRTSRRVQKAGKKLKGKDGGREGRRV
jgi:hypothetical protein